MFIDGRDVKPQRGDNGENGKMESVGVGFPNPSGEATSPLRLRPITS